MGKALRGEAPMGSIRLLPLIGTFWLSDMAGRVQTRALTALVLSWSLYTEHITCNPDMFASNLI